jgi:hypothetical protein
MPEYRIYKSNKTICLTVDELTNGCDVSINTIKAGLKRQRKKLVACWPHHKEGKIVYIHYDGLREEYKELVRERLCGGADPELWLRNKETTAAIEKASAEASRLSECITVLQEDIEFFALTGCYTGQQCQQRARAAAWLRMLSGITALQSHRQGYSTIELLREAVVKELKNEKKQELISGIPTGNSRVLQRRVKAFEANGIGLLVDGKQRNQNRRIITSEISAFLVTEYGRPSPKISLIDLAEKYNSVVALENGWPLLKPSAIRGHLYQAEIFPIWYQSRHGKIAAMNNIMPQAVRRAVSRSNALWSHDGTPVQLYYLDEQAKVRSSLYLYVVTDAHSRAIIGHSLGESENYRAVIGALTDAIDTYGYVPDQVQYDNGSSNICDAVQAFQDNMSLVHFPCQPRRARAKYVEAIFGMFQTLVLRQETNFKGANITARSLDNRANPEHLEELKKKHLLPTLAELKEQVIVLIDKYNNLATGRDQYGRRIGDAPIVKYKSALQGSRTLNYFEKISLFVVSVAKPYKYGVRGIERKVDGQKYYYIVPDDENNTSDFNFQRKHHGESFTVKINLDNPDFIMLFDADGRFVAEARDREKLAPCIADYREGEGSKVQQFIHGTKSWTKENEERYRQLLRPTGTDGFVSVELMDKDSYNRMESEAIDHINGIEEDSELVQRLKSTWK